MATQQVSARARRAQRRVVAATCAALLATSAFGQNIVVLYTLGSPLESHAALADSIWTELERSSARAAPVIEAEFIDAIDAAQPRFRSAFARYLQERYADRSLDAVVGVGAPATTFLAEFAGAVFVGSPLIVVDDTTFSSGIDLAARAVVSVPARPARTVELAVRLQPSVQRVFVVAEAGATSSQAIDNDLRGLMHRLDVQYLSDLSLADVLERVRALPPESIVLYDSLDPRERRLDPVRVAEQLAAAANAPVYTLHERDIGTGVIGGYVVSIRDVGVQIARDVLRYRGDGTPLTAATTLPGSFIVDSAALQRHGLPRARLPEGTEERFGAPSTWRLYQGWIITLLMLVALQFTLFVAFLLRSLRGRKERIALDDAEHRFRLAQIAGQVGFWQWDLDTDEMIIESRLRKLLGFEASGSGPVDWRAHIYKDDLDGVIKAAREHVAGQAPTFEVQHRIVDRNSDVRWFLSRGQILFDDADHPRRIVGTAIDITDRKREEDERARVQAQLLEHRVELAHLARAAATGALSGALAHELKQPLSAILTNAQAGQRYLLQPSVTQDELRAILADIESEARRAGSIIRNLRNMLKPGEEHLAPVHVQTIVHDVLALVRSDLVARNIQVVVAPLIDLPPILGERVQLQQVLLNVINNACDALTGVDPRDRRIGIAAETRGGRVHISVSDNGCGLADRDRDEIFKPFVSTKPQGLGLGLSISRSIVEAHAGRIWAEDNQRSGTIVHIDLPAAVDGTAESPSSRPPARATAVQPLEGRQEA